MPFVHVKSLATQKPAGVAEVLEGLCADIASGGSIRLEDVTATWEELQSGHYAAGGSAAAAAGGGSHPVLVDVLLPDLHPPERVEALLEAVASSLSARAGIPREGVFINARYARSGMVLDEGRIVRW